jgi:hypothetical protein
MRMFLLMIASVLALASFTVTAQAAEQRQPQNPEQWRYTFHNGQWWYWLPEARWVYWQNNRWNDYSPSANRIIAGVSADAADRNVVATMPCILCAFEASQGQSAGAAERSDLRPIPDKAMMSPIYNAPSASSDVGPFYGHSGSAVGFPPFAANEEAGPFYGKAEGDVRYPAMTPNSDVGPFYGKSGGVTESSANMGHFPDY